MSMSVVRQSYVMMHQGDLADMGSEDEEEAEVSTAAGDAAARGAAPSSGGEPSTSSGMPLFLASTLNGCAQKLCVTCAKLPCGGGHNRGSLQPYNLSESTTQSPCESC